MKENFQYNLSEITRFSDNIPDNVIKSISDKRIRSYKDSDYNSLASWMTDLSKFYDGHDKENKLLDQLIATEKRDKTGFFTKNKLMFVCEVDNKPAGMICLNYKRGGSTKIGPVIVNSEIRGKGVGSSLLKTAEEVAIASKSRKLYATTSYLNESMNHLFLKTGYKIEAQFPDQYKKGSTELIWGKHLLLTPPIPEEKKIVSTLFENNDTENLEVSFANNQSLNFINKVNSLYQQWHDDLGIDFVKGMMDGIQRKLSFQDKGKIILVAKNTKKDKGMATFSPKRGGAVKIYPLCGTINTQKALVENSKKIAKKNNNHKLYTFVHFSDTQQIEFLENIGFSKRGLIESPYKLGHNLVPLDIFVE